MAGFISLRHTTARAPAAPERGHGDDDNAVKVDLERHFRYQRLNLDIIPQLVQFALWVQAIVAIGESIRDMKAVPPCRMPHTATHVVAPR